MIKTIIADDEELARERIKGFLKEKDNFEILAECKNGAEAVSAVIEYKSDILFLDIQMPGMNGFEVLNEIKINLPLIIFITAYDEFAVKAFEVEAVDYLLKPFSRKRFNHSLDRAVKLLNNNEDVFHKKIDSLLKHFKTDEDKYSKKFIVKQAGKISFIPVDEIIYLEATGNYVKLVTPNGSFLLRETMSNIEKKIAPEIFLRIHRSFIVRTEMIKELKPYFNSEYIITLKNGKELKSSKSYKQAIASLLSE